MPAPSVAHQWLLVWAIRKMMADGFIPLAWDGALPHFQRSAAYRTPNLSNLRPDAFGALPESQTVALCEAKTWDDIDTDHTRMQLCAFASFLRRDLCDSKLYISIPRSSAVILDKVLAQVGLAGGTGIRRVHVPDCLLPEVQHARR